MKAKFITMKHKNRFIENAFVSIQGVVDNDRYLIISFRPILKKEIKILRKWMECNDLISFELNLSDPKDGIIKGRTLITEISVSISKEDKIPCEVLLKAEYTKEKDATKEQPLFSDKDKAKLLLIHYLSNPEIEIITYRWDRDVAMIDGNQLFADYEPTGKQHLSIDLYKK